MKTNIHLITAALLAGGLALGGWLWSRRPKAPIADPADPAITISRAEVAIPSRISITTSEPAHHSAAVSSSATVPIEGPMDEYQAMSRMNNLKGAQLARFEEAYKAREEAWAAWSDGPGKAIEEVRRAIKSARAVKDESRIRQLQPMLDTLADAEMHFRCRLRANVMGILTLDQQRRWAGHVLNDTLNRRLAKADLTDAQKGYIRALADSTADRAVQADTIEKDPFLLAFKNNGTVESLLFQISQRSLTDVQRSKFPAPKAAVSKATEKPVGAAATATAAAEK